MLKSAVSLWSADLANLESEIRRVDPHCDLYHLDVSDGTYASGVLLFFPDLVKAIRDKTQKPFEVHLITKDPERWIDPFADAGANRIIFYPETTRNVDEVIDQIKARGLEAGVSLTQRNTVSLIEPFLNRLSLVCVLGTECGVKGLTDIAPGTLEKIAELARRRSESKHTYEIEADGAIREHTVPRLRSAGADLVVPGSLIFKNNPEQISKWLKSL